MPPTKEETKNKTEFIIEMHNIIVKESGGELGVRDIGGLEHAVYTILRLIENKSNKNTYISARIYELFATRHYFVDGNKRIAHIFSVSFLDTTGRFFVAPYEEAVDFIIQIADRKKSVKEIEKWIESNSIIKN